MSTAVHAAFKEVASDLDTQSQREDAARRSPSVSHELLLKAHQEFIRSKPGIQSLCGTPTLGSECVEVGSKMIETLLEKGCPSRVAVTLSTLCLYDMVVLIDDSLSNYENNNNLIQLFREITEVYSLAREEGVYSVKTLNRQKTFTNVKPRQVNKVFKDLEFWGLSMFGTGLRKKIPSPKTKPVLAMFLTPDAEVEGESHDAVRQVISHRMLDLAGRYGEHGHQTMSYQLAATNNVDLSSRDWLESIADHPNPQFREVVDVFILCDRLDEYHNDAAKGSEPVWSKDKWVLMGELLLGSIIPNFKEYTGYVRDAVPRTLESVTSSRHLAGFGTGRRLRLSSSLANVAEGNRTLREVVQDIPLIRITDEDGMGIFANNDDDDFEDAEWEDVDHDSEPTDTTELDNAKRISSLIEALDKWDPTLLQRSLEAGADIRWTFKHKGTRLNALEIILLRHYRKDTAILTPLLKQGRTPALDKDYGSAAEMLRVLLGFGEGPCLWDIADTLESILASVGGARNYDELFPVFADFLSKDEGLKKGIMKNCTCFNVDRHKSLAPKEYIDAICNSKPNPSSSTIRRPNGAKRISKRRALPPGTVSPAINSLFSKLTSKVAHSRRNEQLGSETFLPILQFFYILGANPNSTFENSTDTLLHFTAVSTKYSDIFGWLLDTAEVNLDARNLNGDTTLHLAIRKRAPTAVVSGLLYFGADPNVENAQGRTPLMEAASDEFGVRPQQSPFVAQTMSMPNALPPSAALLAASHSVFTSFANISLKPMKPSPLQLTPEEPPAIPEKAHSLYSVNSVGARSLENEGLRKYVKVLLENHASIRSFTVDQWLYLLQTEDPQTSIYVQDSGKISFKVLEKPIFTAAGLPDEFIGSGFNSDYTANVRKIILNFKPNTKNLLSTCGPRHVDRAQDRGEAQWWTLVTETCGKRPQDCGNKHEHDAYQYIAEHVCKPYEPHTRLTRIGPETHSGSEETHLKMLNKMLSLKFQGGDVQLTNNLIFYYPVSVFEQNKWRIVFREMLVSWTMYPCFPDFEVNPSTALPTASYGRARGYSNVSAISNTTNPTSPTFPAWNRPRGLSSATEASAGTAPPARDNSQLLLSKSMRTMSYRSTLKHGFIPDSGVELFTLTIRDLHEKWVDIIEECKIQLRHKEKLMLEAKGTDTDFVNVLLSDAQLWNSLQLRLQNQTRRARRLQSQIVNIELLHQELELWGGGLEALGHLDEAISELAANEKDVIRLQEQTRELIQLEFNLVSIMEAKKSAIMNASMKRLSVITFIFLPLMFITGIFGMNIDLISEDPANPKWYWAIILSLITTAVIVVVWLTFKYSNLEFAIERSTRTIAKRAREALQKRDKEEEQINYGESVSDSGSMTWVPKWVRTQTGFPVDLEKGGMKVGVKVD